MGSTLDLGDSSSDAHCSGIQLVKVMLVDDHPAIRKSLRTALSLYPQVTLAYEASSGEEALDQYEIIRPDVVIMDLTLPGISGLEATKTLCQRDPNVHILIFSVHDEKAYVRHALEAGALGYVCKSSLPQVLYDGIISVSACMEFLDPAVAFNIRTI